MNSLSTVTCSADLDTKIISDYFQGNYRGEVITYPSSHSGVFRFPDTIPGLIFKSGGDVEGRLKNIQIGIDVCQRLGLDRLVIPKAEKIVVNGRTIIAEEYFKVNHDEFSQADYYIELSDLDETIRQIAIFIAETGWNDVDYRNMLILDSAPDHVGGRHVLLPDLEHMNSDRENKAPGLLVSDHFGSSRGLLNCIGSEKAFDVVIEVADRYRIRPNDKSWTVETAKKNRLEEINYRERIKQYYREEGILDHPLKRIDVLAIELGFHPEETIDLTKQINFEWHAKSGTPCPFDRKELYMWEIVHDIITFLNNHIQRELKEPISIQTRRLIENQNEWNSKFHFYGRFGLPDGQRFSKSSEDDARTVRGRVLQALKDNGYIFDYHTMGASRYWIQA